MAVLPAQQAPPPLPPPDQTLSPDQLDDLVAPIALYPDPLLSQLLVAATYPLEVVQAFQWLQRNPGLSGPALTQAAQQQNWDASVQALVVFPDVLKRLNDDVAWTTNLGNAFLAQQQDVMDAVQRMRQKAQQAGKLQSTAQQQVETTTDAGRPYIVNRAGQPRRDLCTGVRSGLDLGTAALVSVSALVVAAAHRSWLPGSSSDSADRSTWACTSAPGGTVGADGAGIRDGATRTVIVNNTFIHRYNFNGIRTADVRGTTVWAHDPGAPRGRAVCPSGPADAVPG